MEFRINHLATGFKYRQSQTNVTGSKTVSTSAKNVSNCCGQKHFLFLFYTLYCSEMVSFLFRTYITSLVLTVWVCVKFTLSCFIHVIVIVQLSQNFYLNHWSNDLIVLWVGEIMKVLVECTLVVYEKVPQLILDAEYVEDEHTALFPLNIICLHLKLNILGNI